MGASCGKADTYDEQPVPEGRGVTNAPAVPIMVYLEQPDKPFLVVFACIHNAGRSQMSCAMFNHIVDPRKAVGVSAGTEPGDHVHPVVVEAMLELGLNISGNKPQLLTVELCQSANLLITMGCGQACPKVEGLKIKDWPLQDPKGKTIEEVRVIREEIQRRVTELAAEHGWGNEVQHGTPQKLPQTPDPEQTTHATQVVA